MSPIRKRSDIPELPESLELRDPVNVDDLKERDKLVRQLRRVRALMVENKTSIDAWNRLHPNDQPLRAELEDTLIAWIDGKGPPPTREAMAMALGL